VAATIEPTIELEQTTEQIKVIQEENALKCEEE